MDPWKDLSASLVKLHDTYYMQHGKMVNRTTMYISESPAAEECAREPYAGAWSPTPNLAAVTSLFLPVAGALDHLLAMATLLTGPPSMYAPFTVARSVLEISVQTWYLLEPGIGAEERALRSVNVRLRSLWEQSQLVGVDESPEWRAQLDHVQRRMDEIVAAARARNISARGRGDGRRSPWVGSGPKSTVKLADECLGSAVPGLGSTFWRSLSSVAHGQAHGLVQAFRPAVDGSTPEGAVGRLGSCRCRPGRPLCTRPAHRWHAWRCLIASTRISVGMKPSCSRLPRCFSPRGPGSGSYPGLGQPPTELFQRCRSRVRIAAAIDDIRFGLHRDLRKIRHDFSRAMPRSTGARAADSARLTVCWVGVRSRPGGRLRAVVTQGPAPM